VCPQVLNLSKLPVYYCIQISYRKLQIMKFFLCCVFYSTKNISKTCIEAFYQRLNKIVSNVEIFIYTRWYVNRVRYSKWRTTESGAIYVDLICVYCILWLLFFMSICKSPRLGKEEQWSYLLKYIVLNKKNCNKVKKSRFSYICFL
jgi:hypothetical protein